MEKAKAHFAKAGYTRTGADGILMSAGGRRLSFTFTTPYKRLEDVMTVLKEEAKKAGVEEAYFDRGGFLFHGKLKALADAAREAGLKF